jgi:hypothetical protein
LLLWLPALVFVKMCERGNAARPLVGTVNYSITTEVDIPFVSAFGIMGLSLSKGRLGSERCVTMTLRRSLALSECDVATVSALTSESSNHF